MSVHEKMTAIADAIRGKTGGTEVLTLDQMAAEVAGIPVGGGNNTDFFGVLSRTVTELTLPDEAIVLGPSALRGCGSLTSVDLNNVTKISNDSLYDCVLLTTVNGENVTELGNNCFRNCKKITTLNLPKLVSLSSYCFYGCTALQTLSLPMVVASATGALQNCTGLRTADFAKLRTIIASLFSNCASLNTLILRFSGVVTLANVNAFTGTPFAANGTGGRVYVPRAYLSAYQSANNWSTLYAAGTCTFVAIEGSAYA